MDTVQLFELQIVADRKRPMERTCTQTQNCGFVDLVGQRHSRIEIVVVLEMALDLISQSGRNQQVIG